MWAALAGENRAGRLRPPRTNEGRPGNRVPGRGGCSCLATSRASFLEALRARALLVALLCSLALPGSAWAHATLVRVTPENRAVLSKPPAAVGLVFDDGVR